jgi:hypothetical protein
MTPAEVEKMKELLARQTVEWRIRKGFADFFDPRQLKWLPKIVKGNRALAMCYIDARLVEDRLDEVVGVGRWCDEYEVLTDGSVVCKLSVKFADEWITKCDVGSLSDQPDVGDRLKSAFSDALKRAAVKFGIGRYIYRMPAQWVDYDTVKKCFTRLPIVPDWAIPRAPVPGTGIYSEEMDEGEITDVPRPQPKTKEDYWRIWQDKLGGCADADALNKILPELASVPADFKMYIWESIKAEAGNVGWKYDSTTKKFSGETKTR